GGEGGRRAGGAARGGGGGDGERTRARRAVRPAVPEPGRGDGLGSRLVRIADPDELDVRVGEDESPARGALSGMPVGRALHDPQANERLSLGRAFRAADEDVVDRRVHWGDSSYLAGPHSGRSARAQRSS